ncbi:MAG: cysteine hydrolase [Clostridiales bacterium]|jgi:nicotinamidase-related amidase|nr:cysteine hydrolase [Clostridiales bacterium]
MSKKTALIIVDMLFDFADPAGRVYYPQTGAILPRIASVKDELRASGALIVFIQHRHRKAKPDKMLAKVRPNCIEGSGGEEICGVLAPDPAGDYIVQKRRYSAFFGTDLDLILRENGIENAVIVGAKTNCCIRATVNDAFNYGYNVYVVRECVATNDETVNNVYLNDIAKYYGRVISGGELSELIRSGEL